MPSKESLERALKFYDYPPNPECIAGSVKALVEKLADLLDEAIRAEAEWWDKHSMAGRFAIPREARLAQLRKGKT